MSMYGIRLQGNEVVVGGRFYNSKRLTLHTAQERADVFQLDFNYWSKREIKTEAKVVNFYGIDDKGNRVVVKWEFVRFINGYRRTHYRYPKGRGGCVKTVAYFAGK